MPQLHLKPILCDASRQSDLQKQLLESNRVVQQSVTCLTNRLCLGVPVQEAKGHAGVAVPGHACVLLPDSGRNVLQADAGVP